MPNIWTHILFGETVIDELEEIKIDSTDHAYFRLGTQGPDPFFYHSFWPWKKSLVPKIGQKIHYENCGPFLIDLIKKGCYGDAKVKAYIYGFITHHILDRNTHPYIIYRSSNEGFKHQLLETTIDTVMLKKFRQIETWKNPAYEQIYVGEQLHKPIEQLFKEVIEEVFPEITYKSNYLNEAYQDMITAFKVFNDPNGLKNKLLFGKITPFSHRKNFPERDYLNEEKAEWLHPTNNQEVSNLSFLELFEIAHKEGIEILRLVERYFANQSKEVLHDLVLKIGNVSYDTGKDCALREEQRFFDPIV